MRNNEALWERIKAEITAGDKGGNSGTWSARKAQMAVLEYKRRGGTYSGPKPTGGLTAWTKQNWRTKSGKPSLETGERYLPAKAIENLTNSEYAATSRAKRQGMKEGLQFVPQPDKIAKKVRRYRKKKEDK